MKEFNSKFNFLNFDELNNKKKTSIVNNIFSSVYKKYDIMNDIMSLGLHRTWKKKFIDIINLKKNMMVLDLACGTCDLAPLIIRKIKNHNNLFMLDINYKMFVQ